MAATALAVVEIGYARYLLPRAKALKVAELMGEAVSVKIDWPEGARRPQFTAEAVPDVQITFIGSDQVAMPEGVTSPAPRGPARRSPSKSPQLLK